MRSRPNYRDVGLTLAVESRPFIIHSDRSFLLSTDKDESHLPAGEASHSCQSSGASRRGRAVGMRVGEIQSNSQTCCGFLPFVGEVRAWMCTMYQDLLVFLFMVNCGVQARLSLKSSFNGIRGGESTQI